MFDFCRKILVFVLLMSAFNFVSAQSDTNEGLKKGDTMVDFGMRQVDQKEKKLGGLVWLSDFVGKKESASKKKLLIFETVTKKMGCLNLAKRPHERSE